jgi:hypothetical protein
MSYLSLPHKVALPISHPFLVNKYTVWYYSIIESARQRKNFEGYTENHHVIPDCFYIENRSKGRNPGWISGDRNNRKNLVKLTFKEHFICHWLLTKMIQGKPYYQMETALGRMSQISKGQRRILTSGQYERAKIASRDSIIGRKSWIKDDKIVWNHECPGEGWLRNSKIEIKRTKCWMKNHEIKWSITCPGEGWSKISFKKQKFGWINGNQMKWSIDCPGEGWIRGRAKKIKATNIITYK